MRILDTRKKEPFVTLHETNLVRTGSSCDGSCFFYSFYTAFRSFRELSEDQKREYIIQLRDKFSSAISQSLERSLASPSTINPYFFISLLKALREVLGEFYPQRRGATADLSSPQRGEESPWISSPLLPIFTSLVSAKELDHPILSMFNDEVEKNAYRNFEDVWSSIFRVVFEEKMKGSFRFVEDSKKVLIEDLVQWIVSVFRSCVHRTIEGLVQKIRDPQEWVDFSMLSYLDPYLPCDVIFLDAASEKPYFDTKEFRREGGGGGANSRDVVLLLYHAEVHYENLGRYCPPSSDGTVSGNISRIFSKDDPLIRSLRGKEQSDDD